MEVGGLTLNNRGSAGSGCAAVFPQWREPWIVTMLEMWTGIFSLGLSVWPSTLKLDISKDVSRGKVKNTDGGAHDLTIKTVCTTKTHLYYCACRMWTLKLREWAGVRLRKSPEFDLLDYSSTTVRQKARIWPAGEWGQETLYLMTSVFSMPCPLLLGDRQSLGSSLNLKLMFLHSEKSLALKQGLKEQLQWIWAAFGIKMAILISD